MFDIATIQELDSATLTLAHPTTGELLACSLELAGPGHPKRKSCEFQRARVIRARVEKKGRLQMTDPEEDEAYDIDRLVACTVGWSGFAENGSAMECTPANVRKLYEGAAWIRSQALEFLEDKSRFLKSCAKG